MTGSGAVGMTHMDGAGTEEGVHNLLQRVQELASGYQEGRLELQLVGGFINTRRNFSEELFSDIMSKLSKKSGRRKKLSYMKKILNVGRKKFALPIGRNCLDLRQKNSII